MKRPLSSVLLLLILLSLSSACEKVLDYDLSYPGPTLSMDTRIFARDSISVLISTTSRAIGSQRPGIPDDCVVQLYEDDVLRAELQPYFVATYENPLNGRITPIYKYATTLTASANANRTYRLEVSKDGYPPISGETTMPQPPEAQRIFFDHSNSVYRVQITDIPNEDNWYMLRTRSINIENSLIVPFTTKDPTLEVFELEINEGQLPTRLKTFVGYLTDTRFKNGQKILEIEIPPIEDRETTALVLEVINITEDYYLFEKSLSGFETYDDFFSEPVQVHSNVENGYGIVASGNERTVQLFP